jgi:hypothetical protein
MCFCSAFTVKPGSLPSQVRWIFVVARVISSLIAPVRNHVFRGPDELHPIVYLGVRNPGRRLIDGGGNTTGCLANQRDLRSRSKSFCWNLGLEILINQQPFGRMLIFIMGIWQKLELSHHQPRLSPPNFSLG